MSDAFEGIFEKLKRSHENIRHLEIEINRFLNDGPYPRLSDDNEKIIPEALKYHMGRSIPPRFSVLAGEIVHHLRSCLDHVVWTFSDPTYRQVHERFIDFPILEMRPPKETVFTRYERKIKGISDTRITCLIERLQPYNSADPPSELLAILQKMDITDKHRELVIIAKTGALLLPAGLMEQIESYQGSEPERFIAQATAQFKSNGKIVPQIAFDNFRGGEAEIVVQALMLLHNHVALILKDFSRFKP